MLAFGLIEFLELVVSLFVFVAPLVVFGYSVFLLYCGAGFKDMGTRFNRVTLIARLILTLIMCPLIVSLFRATITIAPLVEGWSQMAAGAPTESALTFLWDFSSFFTSIWFQIESLYSGFLIDDNWILSAVLAILLIVVYQFLSIKIFGLSDHFDKIDSEAWKRDREYNNNLPRRYRIDTSTYGTGDSVRMETKVTDVTPYHVSPSSFSLQVIVMFITMILTPYLAFFVELGETIFYLIKLSRK